MDLYCAALVHLARRRERILLNPLCSITNPPSRHLTHLSGRRRRRGEGHVEQAAQKVSMALAMHYAADEDTLRQCAGRGHLLPPALGCLFAFFFNLVDVLCCCSYLIHMGN
ncbi:hypothetical protein VPH35_010003 [Triticum aestivum]